MLSRFSFQENQHELSPTSQSPPALMWPSMSQDAPTHLPTLPWTFPLTSSRNGELPNLISSTSKETSQIPSQNLLTSSELNISSATSFNKTTPHQYQSHQPQEEHSDSKFNNSEPYPSNQKPWATLPASKQNTENSELKWTSSTTPTTTLVAPLQTSTSLPEITKLFK